MRKGYCILTFLVFSSFLFSQENDKNQLQTYSKFDFVSGERVVFYDDFSDVAIGDFPVNWDTQAAGEVVLTNNYPGKWLMLKGEYSYFSPVIEDLILPENFTIEFEVIVSEWYDLILEIYNNPSGMITNDYYPGTGGTFLGFVIDGITWKLWRENMENNPESFSQHPEVKEGDKVRYSIWGQKTRIRVYCNETKVIDIPRGLNKNLIHNYLRFGNYSDKATLIGDFRVTIGMPDLRSRLLTEGKLVTHGITFNSGSSLIKPESFGVIKQIADLLNENSELSVKIVGHTDNIGSEKDNLKLSAERALAVKKILNDKFGIANQRMKTEGKGENEPTDNNSTSNGRANNRRVEFIKI